MYKDFSFLKNALQRAVAEGLSQNFTPMQQLPLGYPSNRGNIHKKRPHGRVIERDGRRLHVTKGWRD